MGQFKKRETGIEGLFFLETLSFSDHRGSFSELYRESLFKELGIRKSFVQVNQSTSRRGTLRGLHFQERNPQAKLLRVLSGSLYDVVVDLRKESPSYGQYYSTHLSAEDARWMYIPEGFAHGFLALEDETRIEYFCTEYYNPETERGIFWKDKFLNIDWKLEEFGFHEKDLLLSEKDQKHKSFLEYEAEKQEARVLLLGAGGQLGKAFQSLWKEKGISYLALSKEDLDIRETELGENYFEKERWRAVINCAAYNEVDQAEIAKEDCYAINTMAVAEWMKRCQREKIPFVTFSTDFVFDGNKEFPYTEKDLENPLSIYGKSKQEGEQLALAYEKSLVIRSSWLFGDGKNFCQQVLAWAKEKEDLAIVEDQISSPTYTKDLAYYTWELLEKEFYGLYHITSEGETSKYDLAKYILKKVGWQGELRRAQSKDFPSLASRPSYSKLSSQQVEECLGLRMPHWKVAVLEYLKSLGVIL